MSAPLKRATSRCAHHPALTCWAVHIPAATRLMRRGEEWQSTDRHYFSAVIAMARLAAIVKNEFVTRVG